jgi:hypothetical protein
METGSTRLAVGALLVAVGLVLLIGTLRNPVFDPALGHRSSVDEGTAAVEVTEAGDHVVYLEADACAMAAIELTRVGEQPVTLSPLADGRFNTYEFDGLCGQPVGVAAIPVAGLWTAALPLAERGNIALYETSEPPTSIDWGLSWLFVPALVGGAVLVGQGALQRTRWQRGVDGLS